MSKANEELFNILDKYNDMVTIYCQESDRAVAILATSYLEVLLEKLLRTRLIESPKVNDLFTGNGPLASLSARIDICYALGLMPDHVLHDLTLIRRIRNYFAHHLNEASFQDQAVINRCSELSLHELFPKMDSGSNIPSDARVQFLLSVAMASLTMTQPIHEEWIARQHGKKSDNE